MKPARWLRGNWRLGTAGPTRRKSRPDRELAGAVPIDQMRKPVEAGLFGIFPGDGLQHGLLANDPVIRQRLGVPQFAPGAQRMQWFWADSHSFSAMRRLCPKDVYRAYPCHITVRNEHFLCQAQGVDLA
jgi:hypothetical protein